MISLICNYGVLHGCCTTNKDDCDIIIEAKADDVGIAIRFITYSNNFINLLQ